MLQDLPRAHKRQSSENKKPHIQLQLIFLTTVPHTSSPDISLRITTIFTFFLPSPSTYQKINTHSQFLLYLRVVNSNDPFLDHAFWIFHLLTPKNIPSPTSLHVFLFSIPEFLMVSLHLANKNCPFWFQRKHSDTFYRKHKFYHNQV